jgi:hypothetical protein
VNTVLGHGQGAGASRQSGIDNVSMLPDGRYLTRWGSCTRVMTSVRVTLVFGGTAAYVGLAILAGGWPAFFSDPSRSRSHFPSWLVYHCLLVAI